MGNDGGSIPDRRDLVKSKPKAEQADRANQARARWFFCALSKSPLAEPIVACALGKMYNKDALLEFLLDRAAYGDGEVICGHVRGMKDVKTLTLTPNPALASSSSAADVEDTNHHGSMPRPRWVCPLTFKEMSGGVPFVYLTTCGCVFSRAGLSAVTGSAKKSDSPPSGSTPPAEDAPKVPEEKQKELCPQCAAKFSSSDVVSLNPSEEEEERMRLALTAARALEPVKVKKSKKRKADTAAADAAAETASAVTLPPEAKKAKVAVTPQIAAASRALAAGLAMEEAKRKTNMSDAVKSLYKKDDARTQTWATMGTFTRYA